MKYNFAFVFLFFINLSIAQVEQPNLPRLVQYSGKIVQFDTGKPIQGVRVTNLNKELITLTSVEGYFTIVASPSDRIQFSHLGMSHQYSIIPLDADSKVYEEKALAIKPEDIEAVIIQTTLPPLDELYERLMALEVDDDPARELALQNPDMFNILDTIIAHEPSLLAFKNGKVESSPISWFYDKVYLKIKERVPKPKRREILPVYKKEEKKSN